MIRVPVSPPADAIYPAVPPGTAAGSHSVSCELGGDPAEVGNAREAARKALCDWGLGEHADLAALLVGEIVTNAVRAAGGLDLDSQKRGTGELPPVVCLWLVPERDGVLVLVWDADPCLPERQEPGLEDDSGRGLLLVETLSATWGSCKVADKPGKVVWALCQS